MKPIDGKFPEEFTAIDVGVSTTGKYSIAFGQHFNPMICYDIVGVNVLTGLATRRHYGNRKDECMSAWVEFKKGMTAPRSPSEEDEPHGLTLFGPDGKRTN